MVPSTLKRCVQTVEHFGDDPRTEVTSDDNPQGLYSLTTRYNSDGSVREVVQEIEAVSETATYRPSESTVQLAYDYLGRQTRDVQSFTLDGRKSPEIRMETSYHDGGGIRRIVRKVDGQIVRQSDYREGTDNLGPSGVTTHIIDEIFASGGSVIESLSPDHQKSIALGRDAFGRIVRQDRYDNKQSVGAGRGYSTTEFDADGQVFRLQHHAGRRPSNDNDVAADIAMFGNLYNADGSSTLADTQVFDGHGAAVIDQTIFRTYSGGHLRQIKVVDRVDQSHSYETAVNPDAGGNDTTQAESGIGARVFRETIPRGARTYTYDSAGRVSEVAQYQRNPNSYQRTRRENVNQSYDHRGFVVAVSKDLDDRTLRTTTNSTQITIHEA